MKRGGFLRRKRAKSVALLLPSIPKATGRMLAKKGPARDAKHLAKVRQEACLVCLGLRNAWGTPPACWGIYPVRAHHARELFPRTVGRRISDYLTVPLCEMHHSDQYVTGFHHDNSVRWWDHRGIDPVEWISNFSKEGAAEIARLKQKEAA